jgi:hypothetical protein
LSNQTLQYSPFHPLSHRHDDDHHPAGIHEKMPLSIHISNMASITGVTQKNFLPFSAKTGYKYFQLFN